MSSVIEKARQIFQKRHDYAQEWKRRTGGKVIGYMCTYAPEEILYAAGTLPVRCFGSHEPESVSDPYVFTMYCPFCRDVMAQILQGRYDYVDGLVKARSCIHIRNVWDCWILERPPSFSHYVSMPTQIQSPRAEAFLTAELKDLKAALENWLGEPISAEALDNAVEVYNTNRRLLRNIWEYRKSDPPKLSGVEALDLVICGQVMDKKEHNELLEGFLNELPSREGVKLGLRVMLIGSENDDREFPELVEAEGVNLVIEDSCTGTRYFWNDVIPEEDRIKSISKRYIDRPPCPNKDYPERRRFPHIMSLIRDYDTQGVILYQQKFCDPHEFDIPALAKFLKNNGIPTLTLELDLLVPRGQFSTRVGAFVETLELEVL